MWPPVPPPDTSTRILYRCYLFCVYLFRYILMSPAATSEKEEGLAGAPRAPAGGLRPPAPPTFLPAQARGFSGDTPCPGQGTASPCTPYVFVLRRPMVMVRRESAGASGSWM